MKKMLTISDIGARIDKILFMRKTEEYISTSKKPVIVLIVEGMDGKINIPYSDPDDRDADFHNIIEMINKEDKG